MPAISTPKPDADSFLIMATEVHKLLTRPVGTEHARIRQLSKVLRDMANTNYDRGWNDALEAGGVMAAPHPHVGKMVRIKDGRKYSGVLVQDQKGRLFVRGEPDPKFGTTDVEVDESEYELVPPPGT